MRPFTIIEAEQRSDEWRLARAGRLTGSVADALLAKGRSGAEAVARRDLRIQLCLERITCQPIEEGYVNDAMRWGIAKEAEALLAYEAATGLIVRRTGFLAHTELMAGASLDGDIDDFCGVVETKAPKMATHLSYVREPSLLPSAYNGQVHHAFWLTGAEWVDVVSFDPRFPIELQLVIARVERNDKDVKAYELLAVQFLKEVEAEESEVRALMLARVA